MPLYGLSLYDFRDLDLLQLAAENLNDDLGFTTADIATALGFGEELRAVGSRLGWMRRYNAFGRREADDLWTFTRAGERILEANLTETPALAEVPDAALIKVMADVTSRYRHGDPLTATLLRREFFYGTRAGSAAYAGRRRR